MVNNEPHRPASPAGDWWRGPCSAWRGVWRTRNAQGRSKLAKGSKTAAITFPHLQAKLLVAKQGPLLIQLRKQQTCLFQACGL